jgi:hypothetical protein
MKRIFSFMMLIVALGAYAQETGSDYSGADMQKHMIDLEGGTLVSAFGIVQGAIVNLGYETLIVPNFGLQGTLNGWFFLDTFIGVTVGINIHFLADSPVDPYIGLGVSEFSYVGPASMTMFDIPLSLGVNMMLNRSFGIKIQGKAYLLSMSVFLMEVNIGLVVAFETQSGW